MENYYLFSSEKWWTCQGLFFLNFTEMQVGNSLENYVVAGSLGLLF